MTGLPRRLPFVVPPAPGEAFASWLDRTSAAMQVPAGLVATALGLPTRLHHRNTVPAMFGVAMSARTLRGVAHSSGLTETTVQDLLLARFDGGALNLNALNLHDERTLRHVGRREWAVIHGSRACPGCLRDSAGVWQIQWKLSSTSVCPTHRVVLIDQCPGCRAPLRRTNRGGPPALPRNVLARPTRCDASRGTSCGYDLCSAGSLVVTATASAAQRLLSSAAETGKGQLAGMPRTAAEYFREVKALVAAVRFASDPLLIPTDAPETLHDAYAAELATALACGGGSRGLQAPPLTAAASAAHLLVLAPALLAPCSDSFTTALEPLAEAVNQRRRERRHNPLRTLPLPTLLHAQARPFLGRVAGSAPRTANVVESLPQLLDSNSYQVLARHLPGTATHTGRRFAALAAARTLGATSWAEAGQRCGWPPAVARQTAEVACQRIEDPVTFWRDVEQLAQDLDAGGVAWHERRERLSHLLTIMPGQLGPVSAEGAPWTRTRRRLAAAWIWSEHGGGDWRVAPSMLDVSWTASQASRRELYRRFSMRITEPLATALLDYGRRLTGGPQ